MLKRYLLIIVLYIYIHKKRFINRRSKEEELRKQEMPETSNQNNANDDVLNDIISANGDVRNSLITPKMPPKQRRKLEMLLAKSLGQKNKSTFRTNER